MFDELNEINISDIFAVFILAQSTKIPDIPVMDEVNKYGTSPRTLKLLCKRAVQTKTNSYYDQGVHPQILQKNGLKIAILIVILSGKFRILHLLSRWAMLRPRESGNGRAGTPRFWQKEKLKVADSRVANYIFPFKINKLL